MWYALAEFVDNSTQSRLNYSSIIDGVLAAEGTTLQVKINHDRENKTITIEDNSIGMTVEDLIAALKIAVATQDSKGRSKYGMGMKTSACWIGRLWSVTTCEWSSGKEWTATIDVEGVVNGKTDIPLTSRDVGTDEHYTKIKIWDVHRNIQKRTEETIKTYLGSMYRFDLREKKLILLFNGNPILPPDELEMAKLENGQEARQDFSTTIGGKQVTGWFGVLTKGGRKYGGFSLFQNSRQIKGYPDGWKPRSIFGGEDDEGGNSLVSQRLTGEIVLDGFDVTHTKDAIYFKDDEEEELEIFLAEKTRALKSYASSMRKSGGQPTPWAKAKVEELTREMKKEFVSDEIKDAINTTILPPLDSIEKSNQRQAQTIEKDEILDTWQIGDLTIQLVLQNKTENDPHLTIVGINPNQLDIIINQQHPYYAETSSLERVDELIRQYIYDGIAEYYVKQKTARIDPDSIRKLKDQLLRSKLTRMHNENVKSQEEELSKITKTPPQPQS